MKRILIVHPSTHVDDLTLIVWRARSGATRALLIPTTSPRLTLLTAIADHLVTSGQFRYRHYNRKWSIFEN